MASLAAVMVIAASSAWASDPAEEELIHQGIESRKRANDLAALDVFMKAYALHHSPRAAAQMGLAEVALGRWIDAEAHLEEALAAGGDPWIHKNAPALQETLTKVQQHLGSLDVVGTPAGAEVVVEAEVRGTLPLLKPIRVRAGDIRFQVRSASHETVTRAVHVDAGELVRENVKLTPIQSAPAIGAAPSPTPTASPPQTVTTDSPPPASTTSHLRIAGIAGIAVGVTGLAGLATGLAFGLKARSASQKDSTRPTFDPGADESGHRYETLQYVGYAVGAALLAGGVTMYILSGRGGAADPVTAFTFTPTQSGGIGTLRMEF